MTLIGITGTHGAGKGTITKYLVREHDFVYVSVSEFLAAEAERRGLVPDRAARRDIANEYRTRGPEALMEAVYASVPEDAARVIFEPQHTVEEVRYIQSRGGIVVSLDADLEARYQRVHVRGSAKDDVSFEEFKESQEKEMQSDDPNKNNLAAAMETANFHFTNNGTVEELEQALEQQLVEQHVL